MRFPSPRPAAPRPLRATAAFRGAVPVVLAAALLLPCAVRAGGDEATSALQALGAPNRPKVEIAWNRFYDTEEIGRILARMERAFPELARVETIGTSVGGLPIRSITITDFRAGDPGRKPGFWIDGNIHGNEVQGAEVALYTAWLLLENHGRIPFLTDLLERQVFYITPTINPDGRDSWMHEAHNAHSSRGGIRPHDDDGDGLLDEDGPDDLDGDGMLLRMRVPDPDGRWKEDPDDPRRMVRARPEERGSFRLLGEEGFDNDGDGRVNEDGPGGYDPNRNWAWDWQPGYVQYGAHDYPFSLPETRAVADFVIAHPNIAGMQSYHNAAGMILRGPGTKDAAVAAADAPVFDRIGKRGEEMLPGYRYGNVVELLYPVRGGEFDWFYFARGIVGFTNELWTSWNYYRVPGGKEWGPGGGDERFRFDRDLLFGDAFAGWKKVPHPQYGEVEIGGFKKNYGRVPPSFLLEEECHRNAAFTLFHASQLPRVEVGELRVRPLGGGLWSVRARVSNPRLTPTRTAQAVRNGIGRPDRVTLEGRGVRPIASGEVADPLAGRVRPPEDSRRPDRVLLESVGPMGAAWAEWIVEAPSGARFTVTVESDKGGTASAEGTIG